LLILKFWNILKCAEKLSFLLRGIQRSVNSGHEKLGEIFFVFCFWNSLLYRFFSESLVPQSSIIFVSFSFCQMSVSLSHSALFNFWQSLQFLFINSSLVSSHLLFLSSTFKFNFLILSPPRCFFFYGTFLFSLSFNRASKTMSHSSIHWFLFISSLFLFITSPSFSFIPLLLIVLFAHYNCFCFFKTVFKRFCERNKIWILDASYMHSSALLASAKTLENKFSLRNTIQ